MPSSSPQINQQSSKALDAHTIYITWNEIPKQDHNGIILGYKVSYKPKGGIKFTNSSTLSTKITGLAPFTDYCFAVVGFTGNGSSQLEACVWIKSGQKGTVPHSFLMLWMLINSCTEFETNQHFEFWSLKWLIAAISLVVFPIFFSDLKSPDIFRLRSLMSKCCDAIVLLCIDT